MAGSEQESILVIDDNRLTLTLISEVVRLSGYQVHVAASGEEGLRSFFDIRPNLVLLDIVLPGIDGYETCRRILALANVPIIFLSAESAEDAIVQGLDLGAIDYVVKPFSNKVLLARIKVALRSSITPYRSTSEVVYDDGNLKIDTAAGRVFVDGQSVKLSATEYTLLFYLFDNAGTVLSFPQILDHVWGWDAGDRTNVYTYIRRLRRKLEPNADSRSYITAEHGLGYRFEKRN